MMSQTKPTVCHLNSPSQFVAQLLYGKTFTGVCLCPAHNVSVPNTKQLKEVINYQRQNTMSFP